MRINRSDSESHLFTEAEARQLRQENGSVEPPPLSEQELWQEFERQKPRQETLPPGRSIPIAPMPVEELADLLAEALQGHRAVLEELASIQECHTREHQAILDAVARVTNLVINLEWEEENALQEEV